MDGDFAKCNCEACGNRIEFPAEGFGSTIDCPHCGQPTLLESEFAEAPEQAAAISAEEVASAFSGAIIPKQVSFFYCVGLFFVAIVMVLLPIIYVALTIAAAWGVYEYGRHFSFLLHSSGFSVRVYVFKLMLYFTPLFVGS